MKEGLILSSLAEVIEDEVKDSEGKIVRQNLSFLNDFSGSDSVEDNYGRSKWVKTRKCYCPSNAETDCRFHSPEKAGWEKCPHSPDPKMKFPPKGFWLWARNPMYGKPLTEDEKAELEAA